MRSVLLVCAACAVSIVALRLWRANEPTCVPADGVIATSNVVEVRTNFFGDPDQGVGVTVKVDKPIEGTKPLTIELKATEALQKALQTVADDSREGGLPPSLRLTLSGLDFAPKSVIGARVFLNKDDVTVKTSVRDPHYVSSFAWTQADTGHKHGFLLSMNETVRRLGRDGQFDPKKPLKITVILIPKRGGDLTDVKIGMEQVRVSAHPVR